MRTCFQPPIVRTTSSGGIGFCGLLTIVFITLKITGHFTWSWWWVWSPFWLPVAVLVGGGFVLALLVAAIAGIVMFFQARAKQRRDRRRQDAIRKKTP